MSGGGGGSSSSSTSTSTTTNNVDRRQVVDGSGIGVSGDSSGSINISSIDAGAVKAGESVALAAIGTNATNVNSLLTAAELLFKGTTDIVKANNDLARSLTSSTQQAYAGAAEQAQGNKNLVLAGLAVVGIAAVSALRK